jgi:hypothetical protein
LFRNKNNWRKNRKTPPVLFRAGHLVLDSFGYLHFGGFGFGGDSGGGNVGQDCKNFPPKVQYFDIFELNVSFENFTVQISLG